MKQSLAIVFFSLIITSCGNSARQEEQAAHQRTVDSLQQALARQQIIDSMNSVAAETPARQSSTESRSRSYSATRPTSQQEPTVIYQEVPAEEQKRRQWSNKATGALIGAGAGAATGAVVSKKKGTGAIIGGASGAAVGLGVGAILDANKAKKEEQQQNQR